MQRRRGFWEQAPLRWLVALLIGACASLLLRDSVFVWRTAADGVYFPAAAAALGRVAVIVAGAGTLAAYDLFVRDPLRGVSDVHPVLAPEWVRAQFLALVPRLVGHVAAALPVLFWYARDVRLLLGAAAVIVGAAAAGGCVGAGVSLSAPALGGMPQFAGILDAIRGPNPRAQAALIWAPGAALAMAGASVVAASFGLAAVFGGQVLPAVLLMAPFGVAWAGYRWAKVDARLLTAIPAMLGEVAAAHGAADGLADGAMDERRVYAEGIADRLREPLRREVVRVLRHGWRGHRGWLSLAWVGALLAAAAGFSDDSAAPGRVVAVAGAAMAGLAALGPRLRAEDPPWLNVFMPRRPVHRAHVVALWLWLQAPIFAGSTSLAIRQGGPGFGTFGQLELLAALLAVLGARLPAAGYLPAAVFTWALAAA